jgi:hypothetical protein
VSVSAARPLSRVPFTARASCCATDLTAHCGSRSAREGARTAVWLATAAKDSLEAACGDGGVTGRFFRDKEVLVAMEEEWRGVMHRIPMY